MTIDQEDHAPRPADDLRAMSNPIVRGDFQTRMRLVCQVWKRHKPRLQSFGRVNKSFCHQLGCNFNELPHG